MLVAAYAVASCAPAPKLTDDPAFRQLDHAIKVYVAAHPHHTHPLYKKDLLAFATQHHIPLDLSQFEVLEWYPHRHYLQINGSLGPVQKRLSHFTAMNPFRHAGSNQPMKPPAPSGNKLGVIVTAPCRGLSLSR